MLLYIALAQLLIPNECEDAHFELPPAVAVPLTKGNYRGSPTCASTHGISIGTMATAQSLDIPQAAGRANVPMHQDICYIASAALPRSGTLLLKAAQIQQLHLIAVLLN